MRQRPMGRSEACSSSSTALKRAKLRGPGLQAECLASTAAGACKIIVIAWRLFWSRMTFLPPNGTYMCVAEVAELLP